METITQSQEHIRVMCLIWFGLNRRFVYETAYTTDLVVNLFKYRMYFNERYDVSPTSMLYNL